MSTGHGSSRGRASLVLNRSPQLKRQAGISRRQKNVFVKFASVKTGCAYFGGVDLSTYGVFVAKGGYNALVSYPPAETVARNDWFEEVGEEPDLSHLYLTAYEPAMTFYCVGLRADFEGFVDWVKGLGVFLARFDEIGLEVKMRLVSNPSEVYYDESFHMFTLQFSVDEPYFLLTKSHAPTKPIPLAADALLDGRLFSDWGIRVLKGSTATVLRRGDMKQALRRDEVINGEMVRTYDKNPQVWRNGRWEAMDDIHDVMKSGAREITLNCLIRGSKFDFWGNYYGFLQSLVSPKESADGTQSCGRNVVILPLHYSIPCYYKSSSVSEFIVRDDKVWAMFSLVLVAYGEMADVFDFSYDFSEADFR